MLLVVLGWALAVSGSSAANTTIAAAHFVRKASSVENMHWDDWTEKLQQARHDAARPPLLPDGTAEAFAAAAARHFCAEPRRAFVRPQPPFAQVFAAPVHMVWERDALKLGMAVHSWLLGQALYNASGDCADRDCAAFSALVSPQTAGLGCALARRCFLPTTYVVCVLNSTMPLWKPPKVAAENQGLSDYDEVGGRSSGVCAALLPLLLALPFI